MYKPYYQDDAVTILNGDCREVLTTLPDQSANCCVTSPPYFGLRDYGTAKWEGGSDNCQHVGTAILGAPGSLKPASNSGANNITRGDCINCGAIRVDNQIGLEQSPDEYITEMVKVFREVRRVLRDDGTCWLNIGDSYSTGTIAARQQSLNAGVGANRPEAQNSVPRIGTPLGLKTKDLIGIPWMLAFALRADGWYLRQDIIWSKPNPMPESVADRCTKAHEYIFLLSKSQKYYCNMPAISEKAVIGPNGSTFDGERDLAVRPNTGRGPRFGGTKYGDNKDPLFATKSGNVYAPTEDQRRNKRSVWTVSTTPYAEAHFATFPPDLIRPCILAGCPEGGTVLDPFAGSGTTLQVAEQNGCKSIGIELNIDYCKLIQKRLRNRVFAFD